jgi:hypothetical protein
MWASLLRRRGRGGATGAVEVEVEVATVGEGFEGIVEDGKSAGSAR